MAFGLFINHLTFIAGLLFAAIHGAASTMDLDWRLSWQARGGKRAGGDREV